MIFPCPPYPIPAGGGGGGGAPGLAAIDTPIHAVAYPYAIPPTLNVQGFGPWPLALLWNDSVRFKLTKFLGKGTYGVVAEAVDERNNDRKVAIKRIRYRAGDPKFAMYVARELALLRHAKERQLAHVLQLEHVILSPPGTPKADFELLIVTACEEMSLRAALDVFAKVDWQLDPYNTGAQLVATLAFQLLLSVAQLSACGIVHRDIAPKNIFVSYDYVSARLVLGDFGLARSEKGTARGGTAHMVTRSTRAPELLVHGVDKLMYGTKVDDWSVGCVLAQLLQAVWGGRTGPLFDSNSSANSPKYPGYDDNKYGGDKTLFKVIENELATLNQGGAADPLRGWRARFPGAPEDMLNMVRGLLEVDPAKRLTAVDALKSPYLAHYVAAAAKPIEGATRDGLGFASRMEDHIKLPKDDAEALELLQRIAERNHAIYQ